MNPVSVNGLNESVCNSEQEKNHAESHCECKKSNGWTSYRDDYMWNPSTCKCECNKAWKIDEYLDPKNSSGKKRLFGKLVLVCEDDIVNTTETSLVEKK